MPGKPGFYMLGVKNDYCMTATIRMEEAWVRWGVSFKQMYEWQLEIEAVFPDPISRLSHCHTKEEWSHDPK